MKIISGLILLFICNIDAFSQGRLLGRVVDDSGNPVIAAMVYVTGSSLTQAAISNSSGYYTFLSLPSGDYTVKAYKRGMPTWSKPISLSNMMIRQDIQLANAVPTDIADVKEVKPEKPRPASERDSKSEPAKKVGTPITTAPVATVVTKPDSVKTPPPPKQQPAAVEMALNTTITDEGLKKAIEDAKDVEASEKAVLEKRPEIIGGMKSVYDRLQYPAFARERQIEGSVMARVFVAKTGSVTKVTIIKAAHPSLSEEVFRVLNDDVKFQPASAGNNPADGTAIIFVDFNLK